MTRVAIIGCGAVVQELYAPVVARLEQQGYLQVVCLVDTSADRVQTLRRIFPKAAGFQDTESGYHNTKPDLTLITTPPAFHGQAASMAIAHGSHVLCEKPLASSLEEAEAMVTHARRAGVLLAVGFTRRFFPNLWEARKLIQSGALGEPLRFVVREGKVYDWPVASEAPFRRATGGGVLLDIGSHVMDTLCWLFGDPHILSCEDDAWANGIEANCKVELSFPKARGMMQLSWDQPLASALTIVGPEGALRIPAWEIHRAQRRQGHGSWEECVSGTVFADDLATPPRHLRRPEEFTDCIRAQVIQFLRAIQHAEAPAVTGQEALVSMRALETSRAMAEPLEQEWLPAAERQAFKAAHWRAASAPKQSLRS